MNFDLAFDLQVQIQDQWTVYRISFRNYVRSCTKIVSNDIYPPSAASTTMTFDLAFDLEG